MTGQLVGYGRVSTTDQDLTIQIEALKAAGCTRIFCEKRSGKSANSRPEFQAMLQYVRHGDTVAVYKLDRLGRSTKDILNTIAYFDEHGVKFKVLTDSAIDTTTASGRLVLTILAAVAEMELSLIRERQAEGIARAKAEGRYTGRPITKELTAIQEAIKEGQPCKSVMQEYGISRSYYYKVKKQLEEAEGVA